MELSGDSGDFLVPGPNETFTRAGLRTRSLSKKPRRDSLIIIPFLNSVDSSRAMASCCYNKSKTENRLNNSQVTAWMTSSKVSSKMPSTGRYNLPILFSSLYCNENSPKMGKMRRIRQGKP